MKIAIERIKVDESTRIRKDIGDLSKLEESINQVGLINPVLIDENDTLVAGFRRLSACRKLGWKEIEVTVVQLEGDELKMLEAEAAENLFRKEFTHDEILAVHQRRLEIEEARRHKGWFERFWLWLKGLFQAKEEKPAAVKARPAAAVPETKTEPGKAEPAPTDAPPAEAESAPETDAEARAESTDEPQPKPEADPQTEPEADPQTAQTAPGHPREKTPEITEKDGVRHIKWR